LATVLLVEDDPDIRVALTRAFTNAGHVVSVTGVGLDALREVVVRHPEMVVLDLGLPDIDGAVVLRMIRGESNVPVIVATARTGEANVIRLLNEGADDFVVKPFSSAHLLARIAAVLRRKGAAPATPTLLEVGSLQIDLTRRTATLDGRQLTLTRKEFDVLAYLAARPGQVVEAKELFQHVWRQPYRGREPTLHVHVSWLRRKLGETATQPRMLRVVRGVGLMIEAPQ
jgi:DNA-binding response OmpR family regulator